MTALWTSREAARATGGKITAKFAVTGVSIDTRTIKKGDLFVALQAERDGHDFVADAFKKGAAAALVSRFPAKVPMDAPLLMVPDVLAALEDLGRAARKRTRARVVGVTGSVGKTSTKEMLRAVLSQQGKTHAAEASYNNHWGVPLTLARMPKDTDFAVIEIGMNHPGEIAPLARMARPHVAMITTVAAAHLEAFENIDGIAHEKASIFQGLEPKGTAIINGDLPTTPILRDAALAAQARIISFGEAKRNHHRLTEVTLTEDKTHAQGRAWRTPVSFTLNAAGRHFAQNALGVLAVTHALKLDRARACADLALWQPPAGRGTRETVALPTGEITLIDDAFNANPTSLAASLEVVARATPTGRRIAILGDMLELGPDEMDIHAGLADLAHMAALDTVHCAGPRMKHCYDALPAEKRGQWADTALELAQSLPAMLKAGDLVLVKGSKGSKVSLVVDAIRAAADS